MDLQSIMTAAVFIGGIAYALGQVISSRRRGQGEALTIALQEIEAVKVRADRLEKELEATKAEVHELRKENVTLREVLVSRGDLDEQLITKIEDALSKQTRRLVDVIREGKT